MQKMSKPTNSIRTAAALLLISGLSACATLPSTSDDTVGEPVKVDSVAELNPDQQNIKSDAELASDPKLPKLDLDAQTLESLLVLNLASYQGQWTLAAEKAQEVAFATRDYRLARLSTLLALRDDDYKKGLASAELWHELDEGEADPLNMLLITQLGSGDLDGVKRSIDEHRVGKELDEHIKQIAALLTRQKNAETAIQAASYMVEAYSDSAQAALSSAFVAEFFSEYEQSEQWVMTALELKPGWELAAQMQTQLLASQGKEEERGQFIIDYVKAHPESIIMRINLATEMVRKDELDQAYQLMQEVLKSAPTIYRNFLGCNSVEQIEVEFQL